MSVKEKVHGLEFSRISAIKTAMRHVENDLGAEDDMEKASGSFRELKKAVKDLSDEVDDLAEGK